MRETGRLEGTVRDKGEGEDEGMGKGRGRGKGNGEEQGQELEQKGTGDAGRSWSTKEWLDGKAWPVSLLSQQAVAKGVSRLPELKAVQRAASDRDAFGIRLLGEEGGRSSPGRERPVAWRAESPAVDTP